MKHFFAILVFAAFSLTGSAFAAINPDTAPSGMKFDAKNSNGEYIVSASLNGSWKEIGRVAMDRFYRQRSLDIDLSSLGKEPVKLRIEKTGGGAAQIDSIFLNGKAPVKANLSLKKISQRDLDVVAIEHYALEVEFPVAAGKYSLSLAGRIEPVKITKHPFLYPLSNLFTEMTTKSDFYTYKLNSNSSAPFFKEFSKCGTGHPDGYTYGWVTNDDKNLTVKIDFTPDNTMDGGKDYTAVFIKSKNGLKTFKVSEKDKNWGQPQFTYSDKVPYEHKVYSFNIPLSELGLTSASKKKDIQLAFAAYGTAAPAVNLDDNADITYSISPSHGSLEYIIKTGELEPAINNGAYTLYISDNVYSLFSTTAEDSGLEIPFQPQTLSDLTVSRKVFVPENSNFVRYLNILENTTDDDITVDVKITGQLASTSNTVVYGTSDGDSDVETDDLWMATNGNATRLAMANIWDGPSGSEAIDSVNLDTTTGDFDWTWSSVTVPEGETVIMMFFGVPQIDGDTAAQRAAVIANLSDPEMHQGMSLDEIAAIANWGVRDDGGINDDDGIDDEEEDGAPNEGDGNDDGIPDKFQKHVTSLKMYDNSGYVTIAAPRGTSLSDCQSSAAPSSGSKPSYVTFDDGSVSFTVNDVATGSSVDVTIIFPEGTNPDTYFKYGPTSSDNTDHWYEFLYDGETGASINGNRVTLHFVDGERGDSDLRSNGSITDPGSPGELEGSSSSDCFIGTLK